MVLWVWEWDSAANNAVDLDACIRRVHALSSRCVDVIHWDIRIGTVVSTDRLGVLPVRENSSLEGPVTGYGATIERVK